MSFSLIRQLAQTQHARAMAAFEARAAGPQFEWSGSAGAVRVLLVGSGITTGWGVHTHELALMGSLRRSLQARLDHPVDIEQVSTVGATMERAPAILGSRASEQWDALVVAFGLSDAMRLTRASSWGQALGRLLARIEDDGPIARPVPIVVVGIPPTDSLIALRTVLPFRQLIAGHAERLNGMSAHVASQHRRAAFAPMPAMANRLARPAGSHEAYSLWAEVIVDHLHPQLAGWPHDADALV